MGVYTSSDGTQKDTSTLNAFNLVNGLVKAVKEDAQSNIEVLKEELLKRMDKRGFDAVPEDITVVNLEMVLMPNGELICAGKTVGWFDSLKQYITRK